MTLALTMVLTLAMALAAIIVARVLVSRHILGLIPVLAYEIDRSAGRVVPGAVLAPVLLMARRNA